MLCLSLLATYLLLHGPHEVARLVDLLLAVLVIVFAVALAVDVAEWHEVHLVGAVGVGVAVVVDVRQARLEAIEEHILFIVDVDELADSVLVWGMHSPHRPGPTERS